MRERSDSTVSMQKRSDTFRVSIIQLHRRKTHDYGAAWKKRGEVLSVLANIARKVDRIEIVDDRAVATRDEPILDTYVDLLVYSLKYETFLADLHPDAARMLGLPPSRDGTHSDGVDGFEYLAAVLDLTALDGPLEFDSGRPHDITSAFTAIERCFSGLAPSESVLARLGAAKTLAEATVFAISSMERQTHDKSLPSPPPRKQAGISGMRVEDYTKMLGEVRDVILAGGSSIGIIGLTSVATELIRDVRALGLESAIKGVFAECEGGARNIGGIAVSPIDHLKDVHLDALVVAEDRRKEELLRLALPFLQNCPRIVLAGYGHFAFADLPFSRIASNLLVPSLANGYPNTLVHLYQCLVNADRLQLAGVVAEFGMFKGGTTMFLSRVVEQLGQSWKVIGFDTFDGFPPARSPLDMYAHPDCVFTDVEQSRRYLDGRNVEIVEGDVVATASRLAGENVLLTFMDTDNYTSAMAALDVVQERTVVGGAIVFDHVTGIDRFLYTLGERMAARRLVEDPRYFHLHGTGVFYRQR